MLFIIYFLLFIRVNVIHTSEHKIMSYDEYNKIQDITFPYYFSLEKSKQKLIYFGSNHSYDIENKQYVLLESLWNEFLTITNSNNCIVLVEGALRNLYSSSNKVEAIRRAGGEGGFITFLATQANIEIACPEPEEIWIIQELSKEYSYEEIAYTRFAQAVFETIKIARGGQEVNFDIFVESILNQYQKYFSFPLTIELMKEIHKKIFNQSFNPNDGVFFYNIINPTTEDTIINKICRKRSHMRDIHIVNYIKNLINNEKNIFIVYGGTHAIMQEQAIRNLLCS